jgi:transposase-like protein
VDKHGQSVDSLLCAGQTIEAAKAFFRRAVNTQRRWPRKVNLDGSMASYVALRDLRDENPRWIAVMVRRRRYLNNIVEQEVHAMT